MRQPPAFQCYASDWLAREDFRLASLDERGLLWTMLNQVWVSDSLPSDSSQLAMLLGLPTDAVSKALTSRVVKAFQLDATERLICPELKAMKDEYVTRRLERSRSGSRGANKRWQKEKRAMAQPSSPAIATPEKKRAEQRGAEQRRAIPNNTLTEEQEEQEYRRAWERA